MPLDYAIRWSGAGYTIYRVADKTPLATYATYGEAGRNLKAVGRADAQRLALAAQFPEFNALSPDMQRLAVAVDQHARDDDPTVTLIDNGERSGIRLERCDWHECGEQPRAWLEFSAGRSPSKEGRPLVMVDVDLYGGRRGVGLTVDGHEINSHMDNVWTLADLRQLRDDLDRLLRDERLLGALAEQHRD